MTVAPTSTAVGAAVWRARRVRRGMTLVEVMVALMVLTVMSVVVFETLSNTAELDELLGDRDETTRGARVAMARLHRDLQLAYLTPNRDAALTYQTVFVGTDDSPDQLIFASLAHERLYLNARECDQTEISIWAEQAPDRGKGYTLYHREGPRIDDKPDEDGVIQPLAYNVRSFDVRYLDGQTNEWVEEWDTRGVDTPYRLPRMVELSLVLIGRDPEDRERSIDVPFLTKVPIEFAPPVFNPANPASLLAQQFGGGAAGAAGAGSAGNSGATVTSGGGKPAPGGLGNVGGGLYAPGAFGGAVKR